MANKKHLEILKQGVEAWNEWQRGNMPKPDLRRADLRDANLSRADFGRADLSDANLVNANLSEVNLYYSSLSSADLSNANLCGAFLVNADLSNANLSGGAFLINADLGHANLRGADLRDADLSGANLGRADLSGAALSGAHMRKTDLSGTVLTDVDLDGVTFFGAELWNTELSGANFENARIGRTSFSNVDLSVAKGLDKVEHYGPSSIGIDTLYKSGGKIPNEFLRGCGIPDDFITFIPSHFGVQEAIQFYSCFISYGTRDDEFARRLYSRMREESLRVWFAPEEMKGGQKLHEQIEHAIHLHDRLLIILSGESMQSEWVMTEIRNARSIEVKENRRKLFPIRLVDYEAIKKWKCFDADIGKDLAVELREYYIPDFSNWKDHDSFEKEFAKLLRDLRAEEKRQAGGKSR